MRELGGGELVNPIEGQKSNVRTRGRVTVANGNRHVVASVQLFKI